MPWFLFFLLLPQPRQLNSTLQRKPRPCSIGQLPAVKEGKQLRDVLGKKGFPLGQEMMQKATEGTIKEVTYWWPRPGSGKPLEKTSFSTKVGDQICGVGYYKG